jgi:hypothetical protein
VDGGLKEPFLLVFALLWLAFPLLPITWYPKPTGEPAEDHMARRAALIAIGLAMLVLWYSLQ